jgi:vacuolar-type H+-ATPase subunit E/Vma4
MAIQDILGAIVEDADKRIAEVQSAHKKRMKEMRDESEQITQRKRQQIIDQRDQKKRQLKEKAESHARMLHSKAILSAKQDYMNKVYSEVLASLVNLPKDKLETLLKKCLGQIKSKGTIHAAKEHEALIKKYVPEGCDMGKAIDAKGGFRFVSEKEEHDFTFEFIVNELLRPQTEVKVAHDIFPNA